MMCSCFLLSVKLVIYRIAKKLWRGKILTDTDSSNIWQRIFWQLVTVFHHTPVNAVLFFTNWRIKFWRSSWKASKSPCQNFVLYGTCNYLIWLLCVDGRFSQIRSHLLTSDMCLTPFPFRNCSCCNLAAINWGLWSYRQL